MLIILSTFISGSRNKKIKNRTFFSSLPKSFKFDRVDSADVYLHVCIYAICDVTKIIVEEKKLSSTNLAGI